MHSFRRYSFIKRWVGVVSLLLLLQGVFPVQMHSTLVQDDNGYLVQVCTLYGLKTIALDDNGHPLDEKSQDDNQRSPAIAFSELMAEAVLDVTVPVIAQEDIPSYSIPNTYTVVLPEITSGLMPIRAPPLT